MRIRNAFEEFFCLRSSRSNDKGQVWKRIWILEVWSEMDVENDIFWSEIGSGFGEQGGAPQPRIPSGTPRDSLSSNIYR